MAIRAELNDSTGLFSAREGQVLELLCEGNLKKQIAARQFRSVKTIEKQIDQIHKKLGTHHPGGTIATAVARGLVRISTLCLVYAICITAIDPKIDARRPPSRIARVVRIREAVA